MGNVERIVWSAVVLRAAHFEAVLGGRERSGWGRPRRVLVEGEKMEREFCQPVAQMRTSAGMVVPLERSIVVRLREVMSWRWMWTFCAIVSQ